jgi:hypothetical protein
LLGSVDSSTQVDLNRNCFRCCCPEVVEMASLL